MAEQKDLIHIGELANELNITTRTIRYYEEISLMEAPQRLKNGIRVYSAEDIRRLKFILRLKELGITLKEMHELAEVYRMSRDTEVFMPKLVAILDAHLSKIDDKISKITSLRTEISNYRKHIVDRI